MKFYNLILTYFVTRTYRAINALNRIDDRLLHCCSPLLRTGVQKWPPRRYDRSHHNSKQNIEITLSNHAYVV